MDILAMSARTVVDEIRAADAKLGFLLDVAVSRALVVAELALGGLLAERLRQVDSDLVQIHAAIQDTIDGEANTDSDARFTEQATIPFLRPDRPVTNPGVSAELVGAIEKTLTIARARTSPRAEVVKQILTALETISVDASGNFSSAVVAAREIYGQRALDDTSVMTLFDALDAARIITASSVHQISATDSIRAKVLGAISSAHQRLVGAMTGLVLEAVGPLSRKAQEAQEKTAALRDKVERAERKRAELESKFAATIDQSLPGEKRGVTEW
jgi:hypothetical protein